MCILALLTNAQNYQSYMTFVVRDDARTADLLYQQSVTTYQAYNNYPADGATGKSLYDFNSYGATVAATGGKRAAEGVLRPPVRGRVRLRPVRRQLVELGAVLHRLAGAERVRRRLLDEPGHPLLAAPGC